MPASSFAAALKQQTPRDILRNSLINEKEDKNDPLGLLNLLKKIQNERDPEILTLYKSYKGVAKQGATAVENFFANLTRAHHDRILPLTQYLAAKELVINLANALAQNNKLVGLRAAREPVADSIGGAIANWKAKSVSFDNALKNLAEVKLEPTLTAHPTDPLSTEAVKAIKKLGFAIDDARHDREPPAGTLHSAMTLPERLADGLKGLLDTPLTPPRRMTVMEEVSRAVRFLERLYAAFPEVSREVHEALRAAYPTYSAEKVDKALEGWLQTKIWQAADRDGNDNVDDLSHKEGKALLRKAIAEQHALFIKEKLAATLKLVIPDGKNPARNDLKIWHNGLLGFAKDVETNYSNDGFKPEGMLKSIADFEAKHAALLSTPNKHITEFKQHLNDYKKLIGNFRMDFARMETRQNSGVHHEVVGALLKDALGDQVAVEKYKKDGEYRATLLRSVLENPERKASVINTIREHLRSSHYLTNGFAKSPIQRELKFLQAFGESATADYIIANTEHYSDLLEVEFLFAVMGIKNSHVKPLIETRPDLENAENILGGYIRFKLKEALLQNNEARVAFLQDSGTTDLGAALNALTFPQLVQALPVKIFDGNGLNYARGSGSVVTEEQTIQGEGMRYQLLRAEDVKHYLGQAFSAALRKQEERAAQPKELPAALKSAAVQNMLKGMKIKAMLGHSDSRKTAGPFVEVLLERTRAKIEGKTLPENPQETLLTKIAEKGVAQYERLFTDGQYKKLLGLFAAQLTSMETLANQNNVSSRANKRNDDTASKSAVVHLYQDTLDKRVPGKKLLDHDTRAITTDNMWRTSFTHANLWFSVSRALHGHAPQELAALYKDNPVFRNIVQKAYIGLLEADFEKAWRRVPQVERPLNDTQRNEWIDMCEPQHAFHGQAGAKHFLAMLEYEHTKTKTLFETAFGHQLQEHMKPVKEEILYKKSKANFSEDFMAWRDQKLTATQGDAKLFSGLVDKDSSLKADKRDTLTALLGNIYAASSEAYQVARSWVDRGLTR